jgi:alanine dehydrogenase
MALLLTEADVRKILTMPLALDAVERAFRHLGDGSAVLHSRHRLHMPGKSYLHYMAAGDPSSGYMGLKIYTSSRQGLRFLIPLFSVTSGDLLALVEGDYLGQMRTGAASGVATKFLANPVARAVGMIGTGSQAHTQLEAIAQVRKIESVKAFGRDAERRKRFAAGMRSRLGVKVEAVSTAEEAVRDADIVITATTSTDPVLLGKWLKPGAHINAIGANFPQKRELDDEAVRRPSLIAVDSREQSKLEAGDLIRAFGSDASRWNNVVELAEIVSGKVPGRRDSAQVTLFKSNGIAIEDIVVAGRVYELARAQSLGREIDMWPNDTRQVTGRSV